MEVPVRRDRAGEVLVCTGGSGRKAVAFIELLTCLWAKIRTVLEAGARIIPKHGVQQLVSVACLASGDGWSRARVGVR